MFGLLKRGKASPAPAQESDVSGDGNLPTGYPELDKLLSGGLPLNRSALLLSGPYDEKDLLVDKIIESSLKGGHLVLLLARDLGRIKDVVNKFAENFYVLTPNASKLGDHGANVLGLSETRNLNDVNISFTKGIGAIQNAGRHKLVVIDLLSDILLEHGGLTTRKWLSGFIASRVSEGFTVIASLNPLITQKEETHFVIDLFNGVIEIYEKDSSGKPRRFLIIKKMSGRKYIEAELMLDKEKLF